MTKRESTSGISRLIKSLQEQTKILEAEGQKSESTTEKHYNEISSSTNTNNEPDTKSVPSTKNAPGTNTVPLTNNVGTENVPDTNNVPSTNEVLPPSKGDTKSVPGTEKSVTENVPSTEKRSTKIVPGTFIVPGTKLVSGTEHDAFVGDALINKFSDIDRIRVAKRILALKVPHSARCLLLHLLVSMNCTKQQISLNAFSREIDVRKATLVDALKSLELEEIVRVQRQITGVVVDLGPFLGSTNTVPGSHSMYEGMSNNIVKKETNIHTLRGTKTVPRFNSIKEEALRGNIEDVLIVLDLLGIIKVANKRVSMSKKVMRAIYSCVESEKKMLEAIALAMETEKKAKSNPQAYWLKLLDEKDPEELDELQLHEAKDFMDLCKQFIAKSFESPSLEELKQFAAVLLKETGHFRDRRSIVDYLTLKSDDLKDRLAKYKSTLDNL